MLVRKAQPHESPFTPAGPGQAAVWNDKTSRYLMVFGGWGSGKSYMAASWLLDLHTRNSFWPKGHPRAGQLTGIASATTAPTYDLLGKINIPYLLSAAERMGLKAVFKKSWGSYQSVIHLPQLSTPARPSLIFCVSLDNPERTTGWEAGAIWSDEMSRVKINEADPKANSWLQVKGRLRGEVAHRQALLATMTPEGSKSYMVRVANEPQEGQRVFTMPTKENPAVAEFYKSMLETLPPEVAEQYLSGVPIESNNTSVYYAFDRKKHLTPDAKLDFNSQNPITLTADFNVSPGMHLYLGQFHPERGGGEFVTAHQVFFKGLDLPTVMDKACELLKSLQGGSWKHHAPLELFGDPAGSARSLATGQSCHQIMRMACEKAGIPYRVRIKASHDPVTDRIAAVNFALKDGNGQPHWFIHPSCDRLIADLEQMFYGPDGKPDKSNLALSHASDSEGYRIAYLRPVHVAAVHKEDRVTTSMPKIITPEGGGWA